MWMWMWMWQLNPDGALELVKSAGRVTRRFLRHMNGQDRHFLKRTGGPTL
jgi:hypothetical protein